MKSIKHIASVIVLLLFSFFTIAQEVINDLQVNTVVNRKWREQAALSSYKKVQKIQAALSLPFLDDFSKDGVYPDTTWWQSSQSIFVNRDYPRNPVSIGVATFDGIDSTGYPYNFAATSSSSGLADRLVSKPIDLSTLTKADSLYLSFFYQSKGLGNAPEPIDSLMLEFKSPTTIWKRKWVKAGFIPSSTDTLFHRVMIAITDTAFIKSGFQFRFRNYATLCGNVDHWHIDYVYLNKNRSMGDTIFKDVSFAYNGTAMLKIYQAMPWNQYTNSDKAGATRNYIRNSDSTAKITNYMYEVKTRSLTTLYTYNPGNDNLKPFATNGYSSNAAHSNPPFAYSFPTFTDTTSFIIQHVLFSTVDDDRYNDTLRFYEKFYDYFAYDDGTAEAAYGLNQTGSQLAYRFSMNTLDTLKAVQYYWNPVVNNISSKGFRITIWKDNAGLPGNILFQDSVRYPVYDKKGENYFHTYFLTYQPVVLSGVFYVGWTQVGPDVLNVGLDLNINNQSKIFYNTTGSWQGSLFPGSLMIRPVFKCGKPYYVGVNEQTEEMGVRSYPNPAQDKLIIDTESDKKLNIEIYDSFGRMILKESTIGKQTLDISALSNGIYFLKMSDEMSHSVSRKLIVLK